jgi:hypothetical protein
MHCFVVPPALSAYPASFCSQSPGVRVLAQQLPSRQSMGPTRTRWIHHSPPDISARIERMPWWRGCHGGVVAKSDHHPAFASTTTSAGAPCASALSQGHQSLQPEDAFAPDSRRPHILLHALLQCPSKEPSHILDERFADPYREL